jgi:hypothetical protein
MSDPNILILLWTLPIALSLHVFEEFAFPGGFARWIRACSPRKAKSSLYYFLVNAAGILAAIIIALTASGIYGYRLYLYCAALMGGNAATHLRGTFQAKKYCPGTVSSGLLLLPLCLVSHWYFVHTANVDPFSALVTFCAGLFVGGYVVGVDVEATRRTRTALLVGLPITMLLLIFLPAPADPGRGRKIDVYDNFETESLSQLWETSRFAPGAVVMQTNVSRAGRSAAKIVIHPRDKFEAGLNGDSDSERAELLEARSLTSRENRAYEYSFSMFIPTNFPIVPTRLIIAQWKQTCPDGAICSDDAPVLAIRFISGILKITQDIGKGSRKTLYQATNEFRGRWLDFKFQLRFATNETGRIQAWLGDRQIVDFTGVTANPEDATTGYLHPSRFFFKMGLYRNLMPDPMTIYIDEYRKKELPDKQPSSSGQ